MEVEGPTSKYITNRVRTRRQSTFDSATQTHGTEDFLERVTTQLANHLSPDIVNFEQVFHALEMLSSLSVGLQQGTVSDYKPMTGAFLQSNDPYWLSLDYLRKAKNDLIDELFLILTASMAKYDPSGEHQWFANFWKTATTAAPWDIGTLNYDDLVERSVGVTGFEDGYRDTGNGFSRFHIRHLQDTARTRIMHLHGSVYYGYASTKKDYDFEDHWEDLYKFADPMTARSTWFGRSTLTAQSHEETVAGPIITGLRKTDKALFEPYDAYHAAFRTAVEWSPSLLIAGYSFGDLHFNNIIERIQKWHGDDRRVVVIAHAGDPNEWHPDPAVSGWTSHAAVQFLSKAFNDYYPLGHSTSFKSPLVSHDGRCRLYLSGMKDAIESHGPDIINFLLS